jgi:hypothetical protein
MRKPSWPHSFAAHASRRRSDRSCDGLTGPTPSTGWEKADKTTKDAVGDFQLVWKMKRIAFADASGAHRDSDLSWTKSSQSCGGSSDNLYVINADLGKMFFHDS